MHVRVCRECGEEYRPEVAVCADCGGVLEDRHDDDPDSRHGWARPREAEVEPALDPPPEGYQRVFTTAVAADAVSLAERLKEAGLPFRLYSDPKRPASGFGLFVPKDEANRAREALGPLIAGDRHPRLNGALDRDFDPEIGYRRCPACASELRRGAEECPSCGLGIGSATLDCPACGQANDADAVRCRRCGALLQQDVD